ncbi:tetratricopeptide repeat protein [Providencia hangzhouensis]|uniref:tetratricopeptide repeat protein n=1 Tax=Providencia hangzhouensis TaxID=3031799 RepID=UPI0034DD9FC7
MNFKSIVSTTLLFVTVSISCQSAIASNQSSNTNNCNITFPSQQDLENEGVDFDPGIYNCKDLTQLQSNAQRKQLNALRILGIMHERGYLVEQNTEKAIKLLEEAANLGDKPSQHYLGESMLLVITKENADGTYDVDDSRQRYWKQKANSK